MNKKSKLLLASLLSIGLCASTVFIFSSNVVGLTFASRTKPANLDCSYYFDNSEYTSLYDLNVSKLDSGADIENATTWGTVTCSYYNNSTYSQFIQSTDKNGNISATCLYDVGQDNIYPVGMVVSVTGTMTLFNGMSEMKYCSITKDYDFNPYPVEPLEIYSLPTRTEPNFTDIRYMGTREVHLSNVSLGEITSFRQCNATLDNSNQILLFYNSISEKNAINDKINSIRSNGTKANVTGYVTCYSSNNTGTPSLQVLIRHASDIEEIVEEKTIDYLYITTEKNFYYMDEITMSDFTATVYYTDGTSSVVSNAYITNTVDTSTLGQKKVEFAYEKGGDIYTDSMYIVINNTVSSISVDNPVQFYTFNEQFIAPTVYGASYGYEVDISSEVEFTGFDSYWSSDYHSHVFVDYENSAGRTLSTSYEYSVSSVVSLICESPKLQFELGELFDYPTVIGTFSYDTSVEVDVTNRVTISGFDSSTPGYVDVYMTLGDYQTSYEVEIIDTTPPELYQYDVSISISGSYSTGSYGNSGDFEYYRAVNASGYICKLIPLTRQTGCEETLGGALYNIDPIKDIDHITFTYKTSGSGTRSCKLYCGENNYDDYSYVITSSSSNIETTIDLSSKDVNYFKFDSGDLTLFLQSVTVYYSGSNTTHGSNFTYKSTGAGEYRIAPTTYNGTLIDGVSYVDVPTSINTSTGTILSTKRYTYYSYEYVYEHQEYVSSAIMTSPVDVCNYFEAFGCAPANYGSKSSFSLKDGKTLPSVSEVDELFGSDARTISKYSKSTGYATSVPFYGSTPTYYELDIDTNGYYRTSSRQVGRIVAWATGFEGSDYGYGSQVVCTYTDDHYATFKEYNNYGGFLSRFNVERLISGSVRGNPTTLSN